MKARWFVIIILILSIGIKGINLLSALIRYGNIALPVDYYIVHKSIEFQNKDCKTKFRSDVSKNEIARYFISNGKRNHIKFKYVLVLAIVSEIEIIRKTNIQGARGYFHLNVSM